VTPDTDELLVSLDSGVATLTLNRPEARNALSVALRDALIAAVRWARAEDEVRCVLLTGAGGAFCAGMDLSASSASNAGQPGFQARSMSQALRVGVHALITELWELDKPVVAAVPGAAVGPGAHLALACDFALVSPSTKFLWSFSRIGLVVDAGGAYLLPRVVGLPRAKAMVMLGEGSTGEQAVADGLAYRCVPEADLQADALALAQRLAAGPTRALGLSKQLLNQAFESPLAQSLQLEALSQALATTTEDLVEGMASFREKRDTGFRGR
jgi:2-(1,2-epoxy-1,2-dihydrophenyl)acetyl-CoA isomerase